MSGARAPGAVVTLDGASLGLQDFVAVARGGARVAVQDWSRVEASRRWLDARLDEWRAGRAVAPIYGVTTGFGSSKNVALRTDELETAQVNLIRSHAFGVAVRRDEVFPEEVVRGAALLRANTFLSGRSGVRRELVELLAAMLDRNVNPRVPQRGSVGASGDLSPLAHFALVMIGEGEADVPGKGGPCTLPGAEALSFVGLAPLRLQAKEGLALINGTTFSTATLALATHDALVLARTADVACAMTFEALGGRGRALDAKVHEARGQVGQQDSARSLRQLLEGSMLASTTDDRQDPYSLRCAPQVHGASRDALGYVLATCERELNAVTDNPLLFVLPGDDPPWDVGDHVHDAAGLAADPDAGSVYSAGNFHGQPVAVASDVLAIAVAELASISERRVALLVNPAFSRGLPAHLAARPGAQSALMLAQYSAASLVSENKTLAHPASVDSIPTGNGVEDHVPMATWAARKAARVVALASHVLAIELLAATQALEWRVLRPEASHAALHPTEPAELEALAARFEGLKVDEVAGRLSPATAAAYRAVRAISARVIADRSVSGDVADVARAVAASSFVDVTGDATTRVRALVPAGDDGRGPSP